MYNVTKSLNRCVELRMFYSSIIRIHNTYIGVYRFIEFEKFVQGLESNQSKANTRLAT